MQKKAGYFAPLFEENHILLLKDRVLFSFPPSTKWPE